HLLRAHRCIPPTWPWASKCPYSTSMAMIRKPAFRSQNWLLNTANGSIRTSSSTCCATAAGHNEGDDPSMTQPLMYSLIESKRSTRKLYTEALIGRGDITVEDAEQALRDYQQQLERVFTETREAIPDPDPSTEPIAGLERPESQREDAGMMVGWTTAVDRSIVERIGDAHASPPAGFTLHSKLEPLLKRRKDMSRNGGIDWAFAEL